MKKAQIIIFVTIALIGISQTQYQCYGQYSVVASEVLKAIAKFIGMKAVDETMDYFIDRTGLSENIDNFMDKLSGLQRSSSLSQDEKTRILKLENLCKKINSELQNKSLKDIDLQIKIGQVTSEVMKDFQASNKSLNEDLKKLKLAIEKETENNKKLQTRITKLEQEDRRQTINDNRQDRIIMEQQRILDSIKKASHAKISLFVTLGFIPYSRSNSKLGIIAENGINGFVLNGGVALEFEHLLISGEYIYCPISILQANWVTHLVNSGLGYKVPLGKSPFSLIPILSFSHYFAYNNTNSYRTPIFINNGINLRLDFCVEPNKYFQIILAPKTSLFFQDIIFSRGQNNINNGPIHLGFFLGLKLLLPF